jgi:type IV pilus assembly protein PilM
MPIEFKESDIEANISIEAAQYIPYPVEEIYLDFEVKGLSQASSEQQDILLVATRKENVDTREAALKEAGLVPAVVDVEAYALENMFRLVMDSSVPEQQREHWIEPEQGARQFNGSG